MSERSHLKLERLLATKGRADCTNPMCTRMNGVCIGWHCPYCDKPTSMMGHDCPERKGKAA